MGGGRTIPGSPERGHVERIGSFELVRALGAGGMGEVHEAIDTRNGQRVALKMLFEVDPAGVYRLKREFRRMADITHENLIHLYDLYHEGDWWFFTMELLAGVDLKDAMQAALMRGYSGLRLLLRQFARGVHALHQAGRIHRDLKPSNVMVTDTGRVVILDFGLVNEIDHRTLFASTQGMVRGTALYMAPEQAAGQLATPAADWYAVGVILFEVLTGRYPFEGSLIEVLLGKQSEDPPRVSTLLSHVPPDLDELIAALLRRNPSARPGITELLAWCSPGRAAVSLRLPRPHTPTGELVERESQMATLHTAFRRVLAGGPSCVDIVGAAGTGKTALVRRFVADISDPDIVLLESVCSSRESVPFRTFDGLLDAITAHLVHLPGPECEAMLQDMGGNLFALAQVFPVLARVALVAQQVSPTVPPPQEMRRRAFDALKMLLFRIAERRPAIVFFDNLHWGDLDSARLLDHLLAPPGIPACLFVAAYRPDKRAPMLRELALMRAMLTPAYAYAYAETPPLSDASSTALAQDLLGGAAKAQRTRLAQKIASEAHGNPALVLALVEEALRAGNFDFGVAGEGDLMRRLVRARLARVPDEARELFGRVMVTAGPLSLGELLRAGSWKGDVLALLAQLRGQGLIRMEGPADAQVVMPASETLAQVALAVLDPALLQRSHHDLATALIVAGVDEPERIARHLHAAGKAEDAFEHITSAAYLATKALAFDRAAELYRLALEGKKGHWSLLKNCAESLVQAGRGAEAAPLYLAAAEAAPAAAATRLRREAAEQFLAHGHLEKGMEVLRSQLREAGVEVPRQIRELNAQLTSHIERLSKRGLAFAERSEFELGRRELDRIDVAWTAGKGLLLNDPTQAALLLAQCTYMSLESGEPRRLARSLALCGLVLYGRKHADGAAMVAAAEQLADRVRDHYSIGLVTICRGILARFSGRWLEALKDLDSGIQHLREHCPGSTWECGLGQASTMAALEALGEFRTMSERTESLLRHAQEAGDMHTSLIAAMYSALTLLAAGQPSSARMRVREALANWPRPGFHVQHLQALRLEVLCDLYEGRAADAFQRILTVWPSLEGSDFLRVSSRRTEALTLRARASLAALRAAPAEFNPVTVVVEQDIAQIEREGSGHLLAEASLLRAGLAACNGAEAEVDRLLSVALNGYEAAGMQLSAVAVRRLRTLRAKVRDPKVLTQLDAHLYMQDIKDADAWLRVVAPGVAT